MKILYIDDNRLLIDSVKKHLDTAYVVDFVCTGREGVERAQAIPYNLILLDLGLPDINGLEVCNELRTAKITTPILVLTVQKDPLTAVNLLNSGADDYLTKPFNGDVLKARINAILRRGGHAQTERIVTIGDLSVNLTRRTVTRNGESVSLRRKEFDILEYLITNRGHALTRSMIMDNVWESGKEGWSNTVDVHMKHLRDKIDRPFATPLIKTAYGIGYILDDS